MSVHVRTPGELIASIPVLLGFVPLDSIVVVGIGASGRVAPIVDVTGIGALDLFSLRPALKVFEPVAPAALLAGAAVSRARGGRANELV